MSWELDPMDLRNRHYKKLGAYYSACGLPWIVMARANEYTCYTEGVEDVTCPYCLCSDEYEADAMEIALTAGSLVRFTSSPGITVTLPEWKPTDKLLVSVKTTFG